MWNEYLLFFFLAIISHSGSQQTIPVVIFANQPFININSDGLVTGYSIDVFENVLNIMNSNYGYNVIPSYVFSNSVDEFNDILRVTDLGISGFATTPDQQVLFTSSVPYHYSLIRAMVQTGKIPTTLGQIWLVFKDSHFLQFLLLLMIFCIPSANIMWACEFRKDDDNSRNYFTGIGGSIYWTWVTFYGAGDKVPRTAWGQAITVLILIISLVLMNLLTGAIAATLTVNSLETDPVSILELTGYSVAVVRDSYAAFIAQQADSQIVLVDSVEEGAQLLEDGDVTYFVHEQASLLIINRSTQDLIVKTLTGKQKDYEFTSEPSPTLRMLKEMVQDNEGIPHNQQRFLPITQNQAETLPYGDREINNFVKLHESKYIKGLDKPLADSGVTDGSYLLLVLTLRGASEEDDDSAEGASSPAPSENPEKPMDALYTKIVFEDYLITVAEANNVLEELKKEKDNVESFSTLCRILGYSYHANPTTMANTRTIEEAIPLLEAATNPEIVAKLVDLFDSVARSKIDGAIIKMIDLGLLKIIKRHFDNAAQNKFTLNRLQEDIISLLEKFQREHEPCATEVAEIIYKDNFEKNDLITVSDVGYTSENRLWGAALAFYNDNKNNEHDFLITLNEVSGLELAAKDSNGLSDPYFEAGASPSYDKSFKCQLKSSVQKKTLNPVWKMKNEKKITFVVGHKEDASLLIYDQDLINDEYMGSVTFHPAELLALQQKGKASPCESITFSMKVDSIERKKSNIKIHDVAGYLVINMHIAYKK